MIFTRTLIQWPVLTGLFFNFVLSISDTMHLFYHDQADLNQAFSIGNLQLSLPVDEAVHLKVMRLKIGDEIMITDGLGNLSVAEIDEITNKTNLIRLKSIKTFFKPAHQVHIVVAPPKNIARFEWFLEKATEIGIDQITPVFCDHSERVNLRMDRLNKVIISAMKQSLKTYLPVLNEPIELKKFISRDDHVSNGFIAWLDRDIEQTHLKAACQIHKPATVLIGPEGDFSMEEVKLAKERGYLPVSLGSSRLRTETAALVSCFIVNLLNDPNKAGYPETI